MTEIMTLVEKALPEFRHNQVQAVLDMLGEGNTVPFIARYRKERTGSLDEVQIREIEVIHQQIEVLEKRKESVLKNIEEQGKLTPELAQQIKLAEKIQIVEDLYLPFKQKRRTKATIAKEKGLEPLAIWLLTFSSESVLSYAEQFIDVEKEVTTAEEALQGAHEILAEQFAEVAKYREWIRDFTRKNGVIVTSDKKKENDEKGVFEMYYNYSEPLSKIVPHRTLAINRGEKEDVLKVSLEVETPRILNYLSKQIIKNSQSPATEYVYLAIEDSYKRFIATAIERELRNDLTGIAEAQAIHIFGDNLKHLLLQAPLKGKVVLGFDPAYRTGCKLAVVDPTGKFLTKMVIYPHKPAAEAKRQAAAGQFRDLIEKYQVEMIAIGNGTASRESEQFVADVLKEIKREVFYVIVSEAGASVYSASDVAREEFPELHVEERSAVSIARRLQDPLAELIKIDPQAVGVGQYQHDVSQKALNSELDVVVGSAVNAVGVNVNTASPQLLQHISGLNKTTANNIVNFRNENGLFEKRSALKKVPRLGPKAFEQAIGFMRIVDGKQILDNTDIHPESYADAKKVLEDVNLSLKEVGKSEAQLAFKNYDVKSAASRLEIGQATLADIIAGLIKPGRDMRDEAPAPLLKKEILTIEDLKEGIELQGTVRNVVDFGAFVDIGVKHDGLVHISRLTKKFVKHPSDVVSVGDIVTVWVQSVDVNKARIGLTMIDPTEA